MKWVTVSIRLPEDLYLDLSMRASWEQKSISEIIVEILVASPDKNRKDLE